MGLSDWEKSQILKFSIDHTLVDKPLSNFPVLLNISSGSGKNNYDCTDVFSALTVTPVIFEDTFENGDLWQINSGVVIFENNYLSHANNATYRTNDLVEYSDNFTAEFSFKQYGIGSSDDQAHIYYLYPEVGNSLRLYVRTYSSSDYWVKLYEQNTELFISTKYDYYNNRGTLFSVKLQKIGQELKFKIWKSSENIPPTWDWEGLVTTNVGIEGRTYLNVYTGDGGFFLDYLTIKQLDLNNKKIAIVYPSVQEHWVEEYPNNIEVLIHSNTYDGDTLFIDSSEKDHTVVQKNVVHSTDHSKIGNSSMYIDNTNLTVEDVAYFRTKNFIIEWWEYRVGSQVQSSATFSSSETSATVGILGCYYYDGLIKWYLSSTGSSWDMLSAFSTGAVILDEWVHWTLSRSGTTFNIFKNGISIHSFTSEASIYDNSEGMSLGSYQAYHSVGLYVDEFKITFNEAITEDFTPEIVPTSPNSVLKSYVHGEQEQLFCEIERWDHINEEAQLWIKVPKVLHDQPTDLLLYYDSTQSDNVDYIGDTGDWAAQQVWDTNFVAVYHMSQDPSGASPQLTDSTHNTYKGSSSGNMTSTDLVDAAVGKAIAFDGSDDYFSINNVCIPISASINMSASIHMYRSGAPEISNSLFTMHGNSGNTNRLIWWVASGNTNTGCTWVDTTETVILVINGTNNVCDSNWHTSSVTFDNDTKYGATYTDANLDNSGIASAVWGIESNGRASIGQEYDSSSTGDFFDGKIAELHISKVARSASWVGVTSYSNKDDLFNIYQAGIYQITGYVKELGSPAQRTVYLYDRVSGELMDKVISNSSTGYYSLRTTISGAHNLMCIDALASPDFDDLIISKVTPTEII